MVRLHAALHIGAFQQCINEANKAEFGDSALDEEKTVLMYRAMVGLGNYNMVKSEITDDAASDLQAVKRLARYLHRKGDRATVVEETRALQDDGISMGNPVVALMSGMIYYAEGLFDEALRCLKGNKDAETLETSAMAIQTYLKMDRPDMANKELKRMVAIDEDSTLSQLANAWVNAAKGGEKIQEAFYNFEELTQKYGSTPLLLNSQAAARLLQGSVDEAEGILLEAQEKSPNNPDTLVNLAFVAGMSGKDSQRYRAQLMDSAPDHPANKAYVAKEDEFDQLAATYSR